ncbi:aminoglycoside phosphotransferase family protein [Streptomyces pactum]|uniref:Aminoglycoside phosphotransferase family protein n=1 Tax=Streptomyces pactum TaxID=68249 RepID=A0ABS0NMT0_9ACTN|nr:aminoglycoside phosphotransferase family protein [Streptomyces pactum]MBH5336483.1 aminoglycoside phosphotransferase family protein [Streptomyces pactum]
MGTPPPFGERLRAELGSPDRVHELESSPRSRVWRAELSGTPVVIKQLIDAPEADDRYTREVAALRLASRVEPPVVPRILGTDPEERVVVLEYVDHRPPGEEWVVEYAGALARLHAATGPEDAGALPAWSGPVQGDIDSFLTLARTLGVEVPAGVRAELDDLVGRVSGTPGHALLHGDPCPGNDLHTAAGVRFIDFEQSALGDGRVELAYLRIGFPTCWCSTAPPRALLDAAEAAYRTAWRDATGTEVPDDLTDACAAWLLRGDALVQRAERGTLDHLAELPGRDWSWGTATARQRLLHRLGVVSRMAADSDRLPGLGRLAEAVAGAVSARWPALLPLPARRP